MEQHVIKIKSIEKITHDVLSISTDKPKDYSFKSGQATEVSINKDGWKEEKRPFTFTSLPDDDHLEFVIKTYPSHHGVTNQILQLKPNDELIVHDVWGAIAYKGEGIFIAGGAGVTPFIAIFKQLQKNNQVGNNKLIFANKTKADIIHKQYFEELLGSNFINILSEEQTSEYAHGHINKEFLSKHLNSFNQNFYICGPDPMMDAVEKLLAESGVSADNIIKEAF